MDTEVDSCSFVNTNVRLEGYNIMVTSCHFVNCTSSLAVLALVSHSTDFGDLISNCLFEGNHVHAAYTGVISYYGNNPGAGLALYHSTFRNNMVRKTKDSHKFEGLINIIKSSRLTVAKCQFDCNPYVVPRNVSGGGSMPKASIMYYPPIDSDRHPQDYFSDNSFGSCPLSVRLFILPSC